MVVALTPALIIMMIASVAMFIYTIGYDGEYGTRGRFIWFFFVTAVVLVATGIIKVFDLIVAQTDGGPGLSTEVPAKYVYDMMFSNQNLGQGFAASTTMLIVVLIIIIPWSFYEFGGSRRER